MKLLVRSLVAAGTLGACAALVPVPAHAADKANAACETPVAGQTPAHGFVALVDQVLSQIELTPEQSAKLQKLAPKVEEREAAVDRAQSAILGGLADQLDRGELDHQALEPAIDAYVSARRHASAAIRDGLAVLHETLTPEQRSRFADAMIVGLEAKASEMSSGRALDAFSAELGLNERQKRRVQGIFRDLSRGSYAERERVEKALAAFREGSFSIESILPEGEVEGRAQHDAERMILVTRAVSNVLTAPQRGLAGRRLRDRLACE